MRILGLSVLIVLMVGCSREPVSSRIDPALAILMPGDTVAVAGMRLDKLKSTPFYKTYIEGRQIKQIEEFAKQTGLDPRKDLWELLFITNGKVPLIMARGKFGGLFGQEPRFEGLGTERRSYKGYNILGSKDAGIAFMNTTVAIAGPPAELERIIDNRDNAKDAPPAALIALIGQLPAAAHVYVATLNGGSLLPALPQQGNFANLARAVASTQRITAWANLSNGLDFTGEAIYPEAASANQVRDALKGFIGIGRLSTRSDQPEMMRFYDSIRVSADDKQLKISAQAPFDLMDKLIRQFGLRAGLGGDDLPFGRRRNGVAEVH